MNTKFALPLIAVAVLAWGLFHAVGAYWNNDFRNPARFVMVLGCTVAFLAFWGVMLWFRQRRLKLAATRRLGPNNAC